MKDTLNMGIRITSPFFQDFNILSRRGYIRLKKHH